MMPDKDKPWTWVKYKEGMCQLCSGACCTMPVEIKASDIVRLGLADQDEVDQSPRKLAKRLIKEGIVSSYREGTGNFMLTQKSNDDCYYLDTKTRLCVVYQNRPDVCRQFPSIGPKPGTCPANRLKES